MAERKKGRHAYLSDFHRDVSGEYVYSGPVYQYDGPLAQRQFTVRLLAPGVVLCAAVVAAGLLRTPAMLNTFYVILPFVGEVVCAGLSLWALVRLCWHLPQIRGYVYRATVETLGVKLLLTAVCAGMCALAQVVFITCFGLCNQPFLSLFPFALKAMVIAAALLLRKTVRQASFDRGAPDREEA